MAKLKVKWSFFQSFLNEQVIQGDIFKVLYLGHNQKTKVRDSFIAETIGKILSCK